MTPGKLTAFAFIVFLPLFWGLSGCAVVLIGAGAGIGALSYVNGELVKTYDAGYNEAVRASLGALKSLKIPVTDKTADELETTIRAKRADGTPVTVAVVRVDHHQTEIGVRTGAVGIWDQAASRQIHDAISKRLVPGPGGAKISGSAGSSELAASPSQPAQKVLPGMAESPSAEKEQDQAAVKANQLIGSPDHLIYFGQDSNDIAGKEIEKLNRVAEMILQNPKADATIHGYSDSTGNPEYNNLVAESRGNAVRVYLIGKGIPPKRMTVVNHGSESIAADPNRTDGNPLSPRVEIEIIVRSSF